VATISGARALSAGGATGRRPLKHRGIPDRHPALRFAFTLSTYIARQFCAAVAGMLAGLSLLVMLFDYIELLRRAATRPDVSFGLVTSIALLRLPYFLLQILPFAVLLGGIIAFWRLTRSSELIVARSAGLSAWQFLAAPLACGILFGAIATAGISPLSSVMYSRAESLDNLYIRKTGGPLQLAGGQLWLRQVDRALVPQGVAYLHARHVALQNKVVATDEVSVFRLDGHDRLLVRIEAEHARLAGGAWRMTGTRTITPDHLPESIGAFDLPTDLTAHRMQESFQSPDTLSVWALPGFIALLDNAGFSAVRHRLHFQTLLALPLLCGTMVLVAAGFSMRPTRRGGVARMIGSGVASGFALFTLSKVAEQFGQSGALPTVLAAWAPAGAGLMLAVSLLLHLEDG
jgi:lipopolysaccharide export system permease protein